MMQENSGWVFFNGTYNFSITGAKYVHPSVALGQWPNNSEYFDISLGKANTFEALDPIMNCLRRSARTIVFCGTDNVEELSFLFSLNRPPGSVIAFVGAMWPFGHEQFDGVRSLKTLEASMARLGEGSWVVVGDNIHDGHLVRKRKSIGAHAFAPVAAAGEDGKFRSSMGAARFCIQPSKIKGNVPILTVRLGDASSGIDWANVDGLVIAGSGTGSIPDTLAYEVSAHAHRVPIVVSTRCMEGPNNADHLYPGSVDRYEKMGFLVKEYSGLNPLQARIKLLLQHAADDY